MGESFNHLSNSIFIEEDLKNLIIPLGMEEFRQLEENILIQGCRDPLVVWDKGVEGLVLVDGHNRFKICKKHNIDFRIDKLQFESFEDVKIWMLNNQLGRRNLNPEQLSYYRGLKYLGMKRNHGGFENVRSKGQNELPTSEKLAKEFKVSESTIKRDAKFAEGLEIIAYSNPQLKNDILSGEVKFKKNDIVALTHNKGEEIPRFKNVADLHNQINIIKDKIFEDVESRLGDIEKRRHEEALDILKKAEPIFSDKEDRIKTIKGRIISAMNKAIKDKDINAIGEMKELIDKLEYILFD